MLHRQLAWHGLRPVGVPARLGVEARVSALGRRHAIKLVEVSEQGFAEHAVELAACHDEVGSGLSYCVLERRSE